MTKYIAITLTGVMALSVGATQAEAGCWRDDLRVVLSWYPKYLRRAPDSGGVRYWRGELIRGACLAELECHFLSADEYYRVYGRCPKTWVRGLLTDVLCQPPCPKTVHRLVCQLNRCGCRKTIARAVLAMRNDGGHRQVAIEQPAVVVEQPPVVVERAPVVVEHPPVVIQAPRTRTYRSYGEYRRRQPVNIVAPSRRGYHRLSRPSVRLSVNLPFRF